MELTDSRFGGEVLIRSSALGSGAALSWSCSAVLDQTRWGTEGPQVRHLPGGDEKRKFVGRARLRVRRRTTTREVPGGGRQPRLRGQEKGDEKAGVGDEVSLRNRHGLGGDGKTAREQETASSPWLGRLARGRDRVGAGWVPDAGPSRRYLLEVPVDRMQVVLEVRNEGLLPALQRLLVPHAILQAVEHPAHAGTQRLDGTDGLSKGLQVHSDT